MKKLFIQQQEHIVLMIQEMATSTPKNAQDIINKGAMKKALEPMYHFISANPFWELEGVTIVDLDGKEVTKAEVEQEDNNAYIFLPTPETIVRIKHENEIKHAEIHAFDTLKACAEAVGATSLLSKVLNKQELMTAAAIASQNEVYENISRFAKEFKMPASTAQKYFNVKIEACQTIQLILGENVANLKLQRSYNEAKELYEQIKSILGKKHTGTRYAMEALNSMTNNPKLKAQNAEIIDSLKQLNKDDIEMYNSALSSEKSNWLCTEISAKIRANREAKEKVQAQALVAPAPEKQDVGNAA